MWRPIAQGLLAFLFLLVFISSSAGIPRGYAMRSKVDEGLTEHGAGLEYNEWLVNLLLVIGIAVISALLSVGAVLSFMARGLLCMYPNWKGR